MIEIIIVLHFHTFTNSQTDSQTDDLYKKFVIHICTNLFYLIDIIK